MDTFPTNSQPSWSRNLIASNRSVQKASRTIRFLKDGVSGGSTDIVPEPKGMQNGTAPLQNANSSDGKDRDIFDTLQENQQIIAKKNRDGKILEQRKTE